MDKFLEILEAHCQWLAVGLGGLFLGWMLWSYALMTPVAVPSGDGADLTPGSVDDWVNRRYAQSIDDELKKPGTETPPESTKSSPIKAWRTQLAGQSKKLPADPVFAFNSPPSDVKLGPDRVRASDNAPKIAKLPTLPPAQIVEALAKRAYVGAMPNAAGAVAAVPPPEVVPVQPGVAGLPPVPTIPPGKDLSYVRVSYNLDPVAIDKAFQDVNINVPISNTGVIGIKLMRRELLASGAWSPATEVPYIKNGAGIWPPPLDGVGNVATNQFRQWSDSPQGMLDLLHPTFYPVIFGEGPWDPAGDDNLPVFDPEAERKKKQEEYRIRQEQRRQAAPTGPRTSGPPGGARRGGGGIDAAPAGNDAQRPASLGGMVQTQFPRVTPPPNPNGGAPRPSVPMMPGQTGPDGEPLQDGMQPGVLPGQGQPPAQGLPSPNFQPGLVTQPIFSWAYDETVVEGHTYQYQVVYALRNPVYDSNIVADAKLAQVFTIWSEPSAEAWSQSVEVKPTAEFYLAGTNWQPGRIPPSVKINVFKWALGKWQMETFTVFPGDPVGTKSGGDAKNPTEVDFGTGVTLVELRDDPRGNGGRGKPFVMFMMPDGRLEQREPTVDNTNQRMLRLRGAIEAAKAAAAGGVPGGNPDGFPGGMPGAGGTPMQPPDRP